MTEKNKEFYLPSSHFLIFADYGNTFFHDIRVLQERSEKKKDLIKKGKDLSVLRPLKFKKLKTIEEKFFTEIQKIRKENKKISSVKCLFILESYMRLRVDNKKRINKKLFEEKIIWLNTTVKMYNDMAEWPDSSIKRRCMKIFLNELFSLSSLKGEILFSLK